MKFLDLILTSLKNLWRQKFRAFLTIISMMIGAFLISILLSVGNSVEQFMVSQVTMFANKRTISVSKALDLEGFGINFGGDVSEYNDSKSYSSVETPRDLILLDQEDLDKIEELDHVSEAGFVDQLAGADYIRLDGEDSKYNIGLFGLPESFMHDVNLIIEDKSLFEEENVIVIPESYCEVWDVEAKDLIGKKVFVQVTQNIDTQSLSGMEVMAQPVQQVEPESKEFELVIAGVFERSLFSQMGFINPDTLSVLKAYSQGKELDDYLEDITANEIAVVVDSEENVLVVDEAISDLGYKGSTYDETLGQIGMVFDVVNVVLSSFGGIALVVASIGIINTLIMAIYERTREIGVMKAVGATRLNIGSIFTVEGIMLGFFGGLAGLTLAYGFGQLANYILHVGLSVGGNVIIEPYLENYPTFNISQINISIITLVMLVTVIVSFLASIYPAWRASKLDPIKALRHD